jgi:hypothetical protein
VCLSTKVLFGKYKYQTIYKLIKVNPFYVYGLLFSGYKTAPVEEKVKLMLLSRYQQLTQSGYLSAGTFKAAAQKISSLQVAQ